MNWYSQMAALLRTRVIDDWHRCWKLLSVQVAAGIGAIAWAYDYVPAMQQYLPPDWAKWAIGAIIIARIIRQEPPK